MKRSQTLDIISGLLVILWTYAALSKWIQFKAFTVSLFNQALPRWSIYPLSYLLPFCELLIAIALCFTSYRKKALWASFILLSVFTVYISGALLNLFSRFPCSCGGMISTLSWKDHLWFNIFFIVLSVVGLIMTRTTSKRIFNLKKLTA